MDELDKIMEEVQKDMAVRYDAEFNKIRFYVDTAYSHGLSDGRTQAKQEIIDLISTGRN